MNSQGFSINTTLVKFGLLHTVRILLLTVLMTLKPILTTQAESISLMPLSLIGTPIIVTTTQDLAEINGDCSLREAIQTINTGATIDACSAAVGPHIIVLSGLQGTIDLLRPLPTISADVTLQGPGADSLALTRASNASGDFSLLSINEAAVTVSGLAFHGGQAVSGAGIMQVGGSFTLQDSVIENNHAGSSGGGITNDGGVLSLNRVVIRGNRAGSSGGGIYTDGTLNVMSSVLVGNQVASSGGAIYQASGSVVLRNVTLSGNHADSSGGAVFTSAGQFLASNVTMAENSASTTGGAVSVLDGDVALKQTLLANNTGGDCYGNIVSHGYNLIENLTCTLMGDTSGNIIGQDPLLGSLGDYGGDTLTYSLGFGSSAIDAGLHAGCEPSDQRAVVRPQGGRCDIGSFEVSNEPDPPLVVSISPPVDGTVVRGLVTTREGVPLPNVTIGVQNYSEVGTVLTHADGSFNLGVRRTGTLIITYTKPGYLPAQRDVTAAWQDYVLVEPVAMVALDSQATLVNLNSSTIQVARGSNVIDEDGTRTATLFIPPSTSAELIFPDGNREPVSQLTIRATEYTVGEGGPDAMPAKLPPTSAYTYAVELTADEALAAGASTVEFSQPLSYYVENFLDFPVGTIVPVGYYDRERAAWIPSENGLVIKIVSISDGRANVDTNGDDTADNGNGITDTDRQQLAQLYDVGTSLWRVPVAHFTPWDCNFPPWWPDDARFPEVPPVTSSAPPISKPKVKCASVIECQNQILRESIPVAATPFTLNYSSDRVPGWYSANTLTIPLSGPIIPASLQRIELEIAIAGQQFTQSFPAEPNQVTTFLWDGRNAFGDQVHSAEAMVRVGYVYRPQYRQPSPLSETFALTGTQTVIGTTRASAVIVRWQETTIDLPGLGIQDARTEGLGGWTMDVHHTYNAALRTLYLGNGTRRSAEQLNFDIATVVGIGSSGFSGDSGLATVAQLSTPWGVATGPDGSLYIADTFNHRIRRVGADGIITTVAGTGNQGFSGDGGLAITARLTTPFAVAVGPDGSLYIADTGNNRIRRVASNGVISTVAGNGAPGRGENVPAVLAPLNRPQSVAIAPDGSFYIADNRNHRIARVGTNGIITTYAGSSNPGFSGDGGLARGARLNLPQSVALTPEGILYIADSFNHRIRRVDADGTITTVAGTGNPGFAGDGGPATLAQLSTPSGVAVGPDGSLYIADTLNHRIRRVASDNNITTVTGTGAPGFGGDGGPAMAAPLNRPNSVAIAPDGSPYIADSDNHRIRRVALVLTGLTPGERLIVSENATEVYVFDSSGRHLRTLNALTGATAYQFGYDDAGQLSTITDGHNNVTTITRDASGAPTGIVGPFAQLTELAVNNEGFLSSVNNPAGDAFEMSYDSGGLLTGFVDPRQYPTISSFDEFGRLTLHEDAAGGSMTLTRTESSNQYQVSLTTAENRTTTYDVATNMLDVETRTNTFPNGFQEQSTRNPDGTETTRSPDGSTASQTQRPDPRWGMLAPVSSSSQTRTPGGRVMTLAESRTAVVTNPNDPLSLTSLTEQHTVNGQTFTSLYNASSRTFTLTTPVGRSSTVTIDSHGRPLIEQAPQLAAIKYAYDTHGRLSTITQGDRILTIAYNAEGYVASVTDPLNRVSSYVYDDAGRVTEETLPGGRTIDYTYDESGNLLSLSPPGRPAHSFSYNPINQTSSYVPPDVGPGSESTSYTYNLDRQLTQIMRPDGRNLQFTYDGAGRLDTLIIARGTYDYDYNSTTGNLESISAPGGVDLAFIYDGFLPLSDTLNGSVNGNVSRTFDNNFRVTELQVNGTNPISFGYDNDGMLTNAGALSLTYNSQNGLLTSTSIGVAPNALADSLTYNGFGEPISYIAQHGSTTLYSVNYTIDSLGRISMAEEIIGGATTTFGYSYDDASQLTEVTLNGNTIENYAYDLNGNRTSATVNGVTSNATYDDQDRLLGYGSASYGYNANGDLLTRIDGTGTTHYTYDELGNLTQVTLPNNTTIDYAVDGQGRRVGRFVNGTLMQGFLWQDDLRIVAELDGANSVVARFVYATGMNVPEYMIKGGVTYRIITDHLGSVQFVVNVVDGTIEQRIRYDTWGNVTEDTNPGFQPFGFAGGLYDIDTKLIRFGVRDYDPSTGRWTTKDPIGFSGGDPNLYAYVQNDPLNLVDVSGTAWLTPPEKRALALILELLKAMLHGESDVKRLPPVARPPIQCEPMSRQLPSPPNQPLPVEPIPELKPPELPGFFDTLRQNLANVRPYPFFVFEHQINDVLNPLGGYSALPPSI